MKRRWKHSLSLFLGESPDLVRRRFFALDKSGTGFFHFGEEKATGEALMALVERLPDRSGVRL